MLGLGAWNTEKGCRDINLILGYCGARTPAVVGGNPVEKKISQSVRFGFHFSPGICIVCLTMKPPRRFLLLALILCIAPQLLRAQTPKVPDWAQPGSATHQQVPPPADFHRSTKNFDKPLGLFEGQSDIGGALVPASAGYTASTKQYLINSAGYNIWYTRDEFRYLWKKMSGDVSLAADITFPNPDGYDDRKAVLVIRQDLDDDAKEIMTALHGAGLIHLAQRPEKGASIKEDSRLERRGPLVVEKPGSPVLPAKRLGIEKHGDSFSLFVSLEGEPMHQIGPSVNLHIDGPFYVGIGFCSHLPDKSDTAVLANVILENSAGKIH